MTTLEAGDTITIDDVKRTQTEFLKASTTKRITSNIRRSGEFGGIRRRLFLVPLCSGSGPEGMVTNDSFSRKMACLEQNRDRTNGGQSEDAMSQAPAREKFGGSLLVGLGSEPPTPTGEFCMSWSIGLVGRAGTVAKAFAERAGNIKCMEPEESAKAAAVGVVEKLAATMPENSAVKIEASGSQSPVFDTGTGRYVNGKLSHSFILKFETLYGFLE